MSGPLPRGSGTNGRLSSEQQLEHFAGCVYVANMNRALVPDGSILKPQVFRVRYGGFSFSLDTDNKKVTDDAWRAWTQNMAYRCVSAYEICCEPELPLGAIVTREGRRLVNTKK
jgi:hypothetical protein